MNYVFLLEKVENCSFRPFPEKSIKNGFRFREKTKYGK